jgi:hypothetical protein
MPSFDSVSISVGLKQSEIKGVPSLPLFLVISDIWRYKILLPRGPFKRLFLCCDLFFCILGIILAIARAVTFGT